MTAPAPSQVTRRDVLSGAAAMWIAVVLIGQWIFVCNLANVSHPPVIGASLK